MKQATSKDRDKVIHIISNSYITTPTFQFLLRQAKDQSKYAKFLANYAFDFAIKRRAIYLSNNEKGVAICYHSDQMKLNWHDYWLQVKLVLQAINIKNLGKFLRHDKFIASRRKAFEPYLYYWFYGALKEENQGTSARDMGFSMFEMSKQLEIPILAETTMRQNKIIYERFGFDIYDEWDNPENGLHVWLMKRDWRKKIR